MFRYGNIGASQRGSASSGSGMVKGKQAVKKLSSKKGLNSQLSDNELNLNQDLSREVVIPDQEDLEMGGDVDQAAAANPQVVAINTGTGHEDSFDDPLEMD